MIDANSSHAHNNSIAHYVSIDRTRETQRSTTSEGYFSRKINRVDETNVSYGIIPW